MLSGEEHDSSSIHGEFLQIDNNTECLNENGFSSLIESPWALCNNKTLCDVIITTYINGFQNFQSNNMPWEGVENCRSIMAGCSGILYALPAFVCPRSAVFEKSIWISQAICSIMADYVHIHENSCWHGVDRILAASNFIYLLYRGIGKFHWFWVLVWSLLPASCFIGGTIAKDNGNVQAWHYYICGWHVTGGLIVTLVVYLLHNCPTTDSSSSSSSTTWLERTFCMEKTVEDKL